MTLDDLIRYGDVDIAIVEGRVCLGFKPGAELTAQGMMWDYYFGETVGECVAQISGVILPSICTQ